MHGCDAPVSGNDLNKAERQSSPLSCTMAEMRVHPDGVVEGFSLIQEGLIYRVEVWLNMARPSQGSVMRRALITLAITWLPLVLLSLVQSHEPGPAGIPLLHDFATHLRFLVALPLLIIAERVIDPRLRHAARHFVESNLVTENLLPAYENIIFKIRELRDSPVATAVIILLAIAPSLGEKSAWITMSSVDRISLAGMWFAIVSMPLFRLLLLRWLWLMVVWAIFLRRVTRLPIYCVASHPDGAGGLGFLAHTQAFFGIISFASAVVVTGGLTNMLVHHGKSLSSLKFIAVGYWVLSVVLIAAPLLVVSPRLLAVKWNGLFQYGSLGSAYCQSFDEKWIQGNAPQTESFLGSADIQSLADLSTSFAKVREMKLFVLDKKTFWGLALPPAIPMVCLVLATTPLDKIARSIFGLL